MSSSRLGREAEARRPSHAEGRMLVRAKSHWSESGMLLRNQKQAEVVGASGAELKGRERRSRRGCGGAAHGGGAKAINQEECNHICTLARSLPISRKWVVGGQEWRQGGQPR